MTRGVGARTLVTEDPEEAELDYSRKVGERLRAIRRQKRLSLQEVEAASRQEFKASVLGAYERGERAISVPRLQRLARLLQRAGRPAAARTTTRPDVIDLTDRARRPSAELELVPSTCAGSRSSAARGRHAQPLPHDDPGAAPGLQRPDAHHPPRRPAGHRLHPRCHRRPSARSTGSTSSASCRVVRCLVAAGIRSASTSTSRSARTRCDYCAFATWTDRRHLIDALPRRGRRADIARAVAARRCRRRRSVFVGGGTPSLVPADGLARVLAAVPLAPGAEVTVECNPDTVDAPSCCAAYRAGGRQPPLVRRAVDGAATCWPPSGAPTTPDNVAPGGGLRPAAAGFESFNLDLIYGAAGESLDDWAHDARRRARPRPAARQRLRPDRRAGHAAGRRPRPPPRRRRPGRQVPAGRRAPRAPPGSTGTRSRTGPGPATSAATTSSTGRQGDYLGVRLRRPLPPRRAPVVERAHARALPRRGRGRASRPRRRRGARRRDPPPSRGCSWRCAPADGRARGGAACG